MAVMVPKEALTEHRLDALEKRVDGGFAKVDERFQQVDARFDRVEGDIREFRRTMFQGFIALATINVTCFVGVAGLVAF